MCNGQRSTEASHPAGIPARCVVWITVAGFGGGQGRGVCTILAQAGGAGGVRGGG